MNQIQKPDYKGKSIVNLMSSIIRSFDGEVMYKTLKTLPPETIKKYKNVILIVIDGLGYNYLKKKDSESKLNSYLQVKLTSVFPATTACAISTFFTGLAPQQHAMTGWYINLKEQGVVASILRFTPRFGSCSLSDYGIKAKHVLDQKTVFEKIKAQSAIVTHKIITQSEFSRYVNQHSTILTYETLKGFTRQIKKATISNNKRKYVYAYWGELDHFNHEFGVGKKESEEHFKEIELEIEKLIQRLKNTNSLILITSDHGFVNIPPKNNIMMEKHPKIQACLSAPLCGEGRAVYCYVHPDKAKEFERLVKKDFKNYCYLFKSQELVKKNFFGLFKPNAKLADRIGDYTLICKDQHRIKDVIVQDKEKKKILPGHHGGVTEDEMFVPLIIIDCK
ncbi:MAG: alkaline phosphatase family protein [Nanoarchaeota archaeon]|nr:alkaline phosphatase family protein [Nanoarchaeota archaeon]MBU1030813.1 alkaline phosphatase family protein [Nanoarchaeota archaeon]MBU1850176.1 alkaline phosphatase family protein [Nanoarchaeota archaeon]